MLYAATGDFSMVQRLRRAAPTPAPPAILAISREAAVARFDALSAGFAAVLELPVDKRQLFNVLHSVTAAEDVREGVLRLKDYSRRGAPARKLRILVADDNPTNREVIRKILERGGHASVMVNDGEQALDAIERERFDVVLLDRNMPGLGGIQALQAMRLMTRGRERLPIAILSADVTPEAKREALESGADVFLPKPIEVMRLLNEVQALAGDKGEAQRQPSGEPRGARPATDLTPAVVNAETLGHLEQLGSSAGFVEKLIGVFLTDNTVLLKRIEQALSGRNYHEFRSLMHAMKGSSASMGTDRLTRLCGGLGSLGDAELRLQTSSLLRTLSEEVTAARSSLERYMQDRRKSAG
jgi:two-component system sensor histidine kinase RpfC